MEREIKEAAKVNGFSDSAAKAMCKWRAGSPASNAWLDTYAPYVDVTEKELQS